MQNNRTQDARVRERMRTGAWLYFVVICSWSAAFWLLSSRMSGGGDPSGSIVFLIGGAGPVIWAILFTHLREPRVVQKDFWVRIVDVRRMSIAWWGVAIVIHPLIIGVAVAIDMALGGGAPSGERIPATLGAFLSLAFFTFWFGPLPEEIGWRGFAQDRVQLRFNPVVASLIVGTVWSAWHIALFFVPGTFQYGLGAGSARFWIFMASNIPLSVIMGWVYLHSNRSTLSAAVVHYTGNMVGTLMPKTDRLAAIEVGVLTVVAVLVARDLLMRGRGAIGE